MLKLSILRKNAHFTQTKLAHELGVCPNTISQYESGKRKPNIDMLKKIAQVLNCTVDDLIKEG